MKEMMIRLPMIEMAASDSTYLAKHYPKSGRYIIRRDNGDTSVVDVQLRPIEMGEARKAALQEQMDATLAMRRMELDQEYELKKMQLELDTPKRFAQGEWVSGKTLKEIVEVLARGKKEE